MVHVIINSNLNKGRVYFKILNLFQEGDKNEFKNLNSGNNSENIGLIIRTITSSKTNYVPKNDKS